VEEADRLARISLGIEKAEYLAGQFMDAMRSIARIGMEGKGNALVPVRWSIR